MTVSLISIPLYISYQPLCCISYAKILEDIMCGGCPAGQECRFDKGGGATLNGQNLGAWNCELSKLEFCHVSTIWAIQAIQSIFKNKGSS